MRGLYYHPNRIKYNGSPVLIDSGKHDAISLFVKLIEQMAPDVLEQLEHGVYESYTQAFQWYANQKELTPNEEPSNWKLIKAARTDYFPEYMKLKESLYGWATKYHLTGDGDLYLNLALWGIANYYDDRKEVSRKERQLNIKKHAEDLEVVPEALRTMSIYKCSWPYEEQLSLSEYLYFEDEHDDIELSRSVGKQEKIYHSFFSRYFPFVFSPEDIFCWSGNDKPNIHAFEMLRMFDESKSNIIEAKIMDSSKTNSLTQPWEGGKGWDPRKETWKEFEGLIDTYYEQYKNLYRERTEQFLQERGYVKDKEKRNLEHFKWLVDYQIKGWTLKEIADHYSKVRSEIINEDTIFHGIKNTANLVLVHLRSSKNRQDTWI
ncbi:hypothetical protein H6F38_27150 [Paenibacillus sp. EKM208P]|nr:hypothetical protein H6F38_27150 [Paenibacillus sp. EKM208P]